ncbi:2-iminobutanoate/2-iminopropanoate deaminase [Zhongshania aliphaticivorans]|uniref:2-iminobutanoate/2-iminopropanoate deaminase n=1 Tax=Zhongshania aliphaticivorans TaxID=1470434 RepID=A0A5S9QA08_9GAMM|nr:RidA family protein [Zhongshania aliphaticivorans]CAA0102724.1 2-iminobutanoate/2-iminopropanoate deaminase [Zhongshania aliphaticivorans]CAA0113966.1 2-iminobutanoate/2-iminopropanoate deaminase [Zhongshania aliphaticivorans]
MSNKEIISSSNAPQAIGTYSQAVKVGNTVYLSGQIPLIPATMEMIEGGITEQATQVFKNLSAVASAAGGTLNDAAKVNISLTDLGVFAQVNDVMAQFFEQPYPARACVQVAALPRNAMIEVEVILAL